MTTPFVGVEKTFEDILWENLFPNARLAALVHELGKRLHTRDGDFEQIVTQIKKLAT